MKILVVNPNTSDAATKVIAAEANLAAGAKTEIVVRTAPTGPANIGSLSESAAQIPVVLKMLEEESDGAVIAAYSDPGLEVARARGSRPVTGIGESSLKEAAQLGSRIVIISSNPNNEPLYRECAVKAGVIEKIVAIKYLPKGQRNLLDTLSDRPWLFENAIELARLAINNDAADVIVVAGGPLSGVAREVKQELDFPVLDPVACAVKRVERWIQNGTAD
jgi:Asp/Glu/hydantoin racemase